MASPLVINVSFLLMVVSSVNGSVPCSGSSICNCSHSQLVCHGVSDLTQLPSSPSVRQLQLLDGQLPLLDVDQLHLLPALRSLVVHNCSVEKVTGKWRQRSLSHLSLTHNRLTTFSLASLQGLPSLRMLNLSHNPLQNVENFEPVSRIIATLDLSGRMWDCTNHAMIWLLRWRDTPGRRMAGENNTVCSESRSQYRTMDGRRLLDVLKLTQAMLDRCPSEAPFGCSCDLVQVEEVTPGDKLTPVIVEVNCDSRRLAEYPPHLPANTTTLYIRNNSLTGFGPVIGNHSHYRTLTGLYLDGNLVSAEGANLLEGSEFIHRFSILSLARNKLHTLPLYAFDNAFKKRSFNVDSMLLGGNPWLCDCDSGFTFTFQTWLVSQHKLIRDQSEVRCGSGPLSELEPSGRTVLSLSREKLCGGLQVNWWDVTNGVLVVLLLLLVCKFVYDITVYRRTGKLPLVARKFPC